MRQRQITRNIQAALAALFIALAVPALAWAAEPIDVNKEVTLGIEYKYETQALAGVEFQLHKVGSVDAKGTITPTDPYAAYPVNFAASTFEELQKSALTLEGYVLRDGHAPLARQTTDANGVLTFSASGTSALKPGLYLVMGTTHEEGGFVYRSSPLLIVLPDATNAQGVLDYNPIINPKVEQASATSTMTCKVLKLWNDRNNVAQRPTQITVDLLRDGKVYDTVVLSEKTSWRHVWNDLAATHYWTVVEKELPKYRTSIEKVDGTYVVTNTPSSGSPEPDDPGGDPGGDPSDPNNPGGNTTPSSGKPAPATGLLWWPVPLLIIGGICLVLVGIVRGRRD